MYLPQERVQESDISRIYTLRPSSNIATCDKWGQTVSVLSQFRIDTGATCNKLTLSNYQSVQHLAGDPQTLQKVLKTYSNRIIHPVGTVTLHLSDKGKTTKTSFEVIDLDQENVISGATSEALGLIIKLDKLSLVQPPVDGSQQAAVSEFPEVGKTTGTLPGTYQTKPVEGSQGVVHPPHNQPAALKEKIVDQLKEMVSEGHITKIECPTEWMSSMVVALCNSKVHICIDPKNLNKCIKHEHYPMRTVQEVLAQIPGAQVFSVLDACSGFMQILKSKKLL